MRISSSMIGMESARSYSSVTVRTARAYAGKPKSTTTGGGNGFLGSFWGMGEEAEDADKSSNAQTTLQDVSLHFRNLSNTGRVTARQEEKDARETVRQQCMKFLMYLLFGDRHKKELDEFWGTGANSSSTQNSGETYGFTKTYYHSETETTSFSTTGVVKTADGREISFGLNM